MSKWGAINKGAATRRMGGIGRGRSLDTERTSGDYSAAHIGESQGYPMKSKTMDVAWKHCDWGRRAGLTPQDIVAGCGVTAKTDHTWQFAISLVGALYELNGRMPVAKKSAVQRLAPAGAIQAPTPHRSAPRYEAKDRECMVGSCRRVFLSEGPHHRMCDHHRRSESSLPTGWEYVAETPTDI
jgi:hypothetical protein